MPLGFSFAPGSDLQMNGQNGNAGPSRLSPQQAVKILSLRVPEALPSNAPVNRSLLTSPGGSAPGAGGLQSLIQQLIQSFKPQPAIAGGPTAMPLQPAKTAPQGTPPHVSPSEGGAPELPSQAAAFPGAPAPFQAFPNAPDPGPLPMWAPHITWGDELNAGPAAPFNLGEDQASVDEFNRMNLGPSGFMDWSRFSGR